LETGNSSDFLLVSWLVTSRVVLSAKSLVSEVLISLELWKVSLTRSDDALLPIANRGYMLIEGLSKPEGDKSPDKGTTSYRVDSVQDSFLIQKCFGRISDSICLRPTSY